MSSPPKFKNPPIGFDKKITIYSDYYPNETKKRLKKLKNCLKQRGYKNVYLVSNFPTPAHHLMGTQKGSPERNLLRSRYSLDHSDLNLMIYLFGVSRDAVTYELTYAIDNKIDFLFFVELKKEQGNEVRAMSTLIEALLKEISIKFIDIPVDNDDYLCTIAYSRISDFFFEF